MDVYKTWVLHKELRSRITTIDFKGTPKRKVMSKLVSDSIREKARTVARNIIAMQTRYSPEAQSDSDK
jgi:hypothetical protein